MAVDMDSGRKRTSIAPPNRCGARDLYNPSDVMTDIGKLSLLQFRSPNALHHNVARIVVPECRIHHRDPYSTIWFPVHLFREEVPESRPHSSPT